MFKKSSISGPFSEVKAVKNREKMLLKNMLFLNVEFEAFFFDFLRFWLDFGRPWDFQISIKNQKNRIRGAFGTRLRFLIVSGPVLGGFREGLGKVLGGFWQNFERY